MAPMLVSIDRAGRVVIPKDVRDRLSIEPDSEFEIDTDGDGIHLTPVRRPTRRVATVDGLPVFERLEGHVITDADVQRWRDAEQR
jgi:AbrB family looped-hinge helix DNA binding protein